MTQIFICRCHDEDQQGARIPGGPSEWELAEEVSTGIWMGLLNAPMSGHQLEKTLQERIAIINQEVRDSDEPVLAVETHFNVSHDLRRSGFFSMIHKGNIQSRDLAACIQSELRLERGRNKDRGFNVVDRTTQWIDTRWEYKTNRQGFVCDIDCPAVLVEALFLTNEAEAEYIQVRRNQTMLGWAIGRGISNYLKQRGDT